MAFLIALVALLLLLILPLRVKLDAGSGRIQATAFLLYVLPLRFNFIIRRERHKLFALYIVQKKQCRKLTTLFDLIHHARKTQKTDRQKYARSKAARYILAHVRGNITLCVSFGSGSALHTAMAGGLLRILEGCAKAFVNRTRLKISFDVSPVFDRRLLSISASGIFAISPANIIVGALIQRIYLGGKRNASH